MTPLRRLQPKTPVLEAKKSDIGLPKLSDLTPDEIKRAYANLSDTERAQLGKPVGKSSFVSHDDWPRQRAYMLQKSLHANPKTDPELTAYTPGETTKLLQHPTIVDWHNKMSRFVVPSVYNTVVFVPCAKSKPWVGPACSASLYSHYNTLRSHYGNIYFVTISEPLGVVPQDHWSDFPQYDNPGLFKDPVLRSDMFTADWQRLYPGVTSRLQTPFDSGEYQRAIDQLALVIKQFIDTNRKSNPHLKYLSFVEEPEGRPSGTHSDMMTRAGFTGDRYEKAQKRGASKGREPMEYLVTTLKKAGVVPIKEETEFPPYKLLFEGEPWFDFMDGPSRTWENLILAGVKEITGANYWRIIDRDHREFRLYGQNMVQSSVLLGFHTGPERGTLRLHVVIDYPMSSVVPGPADRERYKNAQLTGARWPVRVTAMAELDNNETTDQATVYLDEQWVTNRSEYESTLHAMMEPHKIVHGMAGDLRNVLDNFLGMRGRDSYNRTGYDARKKGTDSFNPMFKGKPVSYSPELGPKWPGGEKHEQDSAVRKPTIAEQMNLLKHLKRDTGGELPSHTPPKEGGFRGAPKLLRQLKPNAPHRTLSPLKKAHKAATGVRTIGNPTRSEPVPSKASHDAPKVAPKSSFSLHNRTFSAGDSSHKPTPGRLHKMEDASLDRERKLVDAWVADPSTSPALLAKLFSATTPVGTNRFGLGVSAASAVPIEGMQHPMSAFSIADRERWRLAIAANPNAPEAVLRHAQHLAPDNPVLGLGFLEKPEMAGGAMRLQQFHKVLPHILSLRRRLGLDSAVYGYFTQEGKFEPSSDGQGAAWWAMQMRRERILDVNVLPSGMVPEETLLIATLRNDTRVSPASPITYLVRTYPTLASALDRLPKGLEPRIHKIQP